MREEWQPEDVIRTDIKDDQISIGIPKEKVAFNLEFRAVQSFSRLLVATSILLFILMLIR